MRGATNGITCGKILHLDDLDKRIDLARLLVFRLERLSVDSYWAHRASGVRGSLLRSLDQFESSQELDQQDYIIQEMEHLDQLIKIGFEILENAAKEIRPPAEDTLNRREISNQTPPN